MNEIPELKLQHKNMDEPVNEAVKEPVALVGDTFTHQAVIKELGDKIEDSERYSKELNAIIEYIQRTKGARDMNDILWEVRLLSGSLGREGLGGKQLSRLYRYVYLQNEKSSIDRELNMMEKIK
jgi:hypothetical protein